MRSIHESLRRKDFESAPKKGVEAKHGKVITPSQTLSPKEARELSLRLLSAAIDAEEQ